MGSEMCIRDSISFARSRPLRQLHPILVVHPLHLITFVMLVTRGKCPCTSLTSNHARCIPHTLPGSLHPLRPITSVTSVTSYHGRYIRCAHSRPVHRCTLHLLHLITYVMSITPDHARVHPQQRVSPVASITPDLARYIGYARSHPLHPITSVTSVTPDHTPYIVAPYIRYT